MQVYLNLLSHNIHQIMCRDQAQNLMQWPEALEQHSESKVSRSEEVAKNKQWGSRIDWGDELDDE